MISWPQRHHEALQQRQQFLLKPRANVRQRKETRKFLANEQTLYIVNEHDKGKSVIRIGIHESSQNE
jgi:hypothetical protein